MEKFTKHVNGDVAHVLQGSASILLMQEMCLPHFLTPESLSGMFVMAMGYGDGPPHALEKFRDAPFYFLDVQGLAWLPEEH